MREQREGKISIQKSEIETTKGGKRQEQTKGRRKERDERRTQARKVKRTGCGRRRGRGRSHAFTSVIMALPADNYARGVLRPRQPYAHAEGDMQAYSLALPGFRWQRFLCLV